VPPEQLSRLFEPFHRGEGETGGFGLGLAIARRAVVVHDGMIVLKNRLPAGFQVGITLPARWEEAAPEGEAEHNS
jgi:signal transduction histidine kinase